MYDTFFEIFLSGNYSLRAGWAKAQDEFDCQDLCRVVHLSWSWLSWMYSKISRRRWFFFGKTENSHGGLRLENVFQDEWWMNAGVKHSLCKYDIITFINFISQSYMPFCVKLCVWNGELHILKPRAQPAGCTRMFCEYAKEFLAAMQKVGGEMDHEDGELEGWRMPWELWNFPDETLWTFCGFAGTGELAVKCCKQNHIYQLLYPDPANLGQQMICQNQKQAIGVGRWMIPPQVTSVFIRFSSS